MAKLAGELASILDHVGKLQEVDTSGVLPTSQVIQSENTWREDIVQSSLPVEAVLANAPRRADNLFEVQAIL
jgi:aspartyl-tRNA(Asn)/glutamyl-tRNA(Gln) amidotransferase subunit C